MPEVQYWRSVPGDVVVRWNWLKLQGLERWVTCQVLRGHAGGQQKERDFSCAGIAWVTPDGWCLIVWGCALKLRGLGCSLRSPLCPQLQSYSYLFSSVSRENREGLRGYPSDMEPMWSVGSPLPNPQHVYSSKSCNEIILFYTVGGERPFSVHSRS